MLTVGKRQLYIFLSNGGKDSTYQEFMDTWDNDVDEEDLAGDERLSDFAITKDEFEYLLKADIKEIIAGSEMSENHLGGDDLVEVADSVLNAIKDGYTVVTWYGPQSEALVAGVRAAELKVVD